MSTESAESHPTEVDSPNPEIAESDPELSCPNDGCDFQFFTAPSAFGVREKIIDSRYSEYQSPCRHFVGRYRPAHDNFSQFIAEVQAHPDVVAVGDCESYGDPADTPMVAYQVTPDFDPANGGGEA